MIAQAISRDGNLPAALPPAPWISKPAREDGSSGIGIDAVTGDRKTLARRVRRLYEAFRQTVLIESYIDGREFCVGVVGAAMLPVSEVDFSGYPEGEPRIVAYEAKWRPDTDYFRGTTTRCPAPIPPELSRRLASLGRSALDAMGVHGYGRVDMRGDASGQFFILEVNPNPDLSPDAGLARMADAEGWGYNGLVERILARAFTPIPPRQKRPAP